MDMKFDLNALMDQMKDYAILGFISSQIENEKDRTFITESMKLLMDHGMSAETAFDVLMKLSELGKKHK